MLNHLPFVTVNYNQPSATISYVESLFQSRHDYSGRISVIIIDNASTDSSVNDILAWAESRSSAPSRTLRDIPESLPGYQYKHFALDAQFRLILISTPGNRGYAGACDLGRCFCEHLSNVTWVVFSNNDVAVKPSEIARFAQSLDDLPADAGLAGPKICGPGKNADWQRPETQPPSVLNWYVKAILFKLRSMGYKPPLYEHYWYTGDSIREVQMVPGSFFAGRQKALAECGGFDLNTFLYWEEHIIADRLRCADYKVYYLPTISVEHQWSLSVTPVHTRHLIISTLYYFRCYQPTNSLAMSALRAGLFILAVYRILRTRDQLSKQDMLSLLGAVWHPFQD